MARCQFPHTATAPQEQRHDFKSFPWMASITVQCSLQPSCLMSWTSAQSTSKRETRLRLGCLGLGTGLGCIKDTSRSSTGSSAAKLLSRHCTVPGLGLPESVNSACHTQDCKPYSTGKQQACQAQDGGANTPVQQLQGWCGP